MEKHRLERLMRIARTTGAPLVVAGEENDFVLMDIDQYEALILEWDPSASLQHQFSEPEFPQQDEADVPEEFFMPEAADVQDSSSAPIQEKKVELQDEDGEDFGEEQFYLEPIE